MKSKKRGFTLIEVSLFLGVTALLFVGITVGMQNSITQQRFSDSVNNFADFLRNIYSQVSNPQSNGTGNSDKAIIGKLITFGENTNMTGDSNNNNQIFVYDIIGDADRNSISSGGSLSGLLTQLKASVVGASGRPKPTGVSSLSVAPVGVEEFYLPKWQTKIQDKNKNTLNLTIAVVRHPKSGVINTIVYNGATQINKQLKDMAYSGKKVIYHNGGCIENCNLVDGFIKWQTDSGEPNYVARDVEFCVAPFGESDRRQMVKLEKGARNSSAVVVVDLDGSDNHCK